MCDVGSSEKEHGHFAFHKIGCKDRQPVKMTIRPAEFHREVLTVDETGFIQGL
jgi:hypothetical protein